MKLGLLGPERERHDEDAATAVEVPIGEARPLGISQYSTATISEVEGSPSEAGSSWPGADDTTRPDSASVAKAVHDSIRARSVFGGSQVRAARRGGQCWR